MAVLTVTKTLWLITVTVEEMGQTRTSACGFVSQRRPPRPIISTPAPSLSQIVVAVTTALTVPRGPLRDKKRVSPLVAAVAPYIPLTGDASAGPNIEIDAVLVRPLLLTAIRGVVRVAQTETARVPPARSLAGVILTPRQGFARAVRLMPLLTVTTGPLKTSCRLALAFSPDGVDTQNKPLQVAIELLDGLPSRPQPRRAFTKVGPLSATRGP